MRRYFIIEGDKTTSGGTVLEGASCATISGKAQTCHGARVYCPACKSEGRIVGTGPTRPHTLNGKQAALENDLCICKCEPPPRLISSQRIAWMSFDGGEDDNGVGAYDRHFRFVDEDGKPVSGIRVHLTDMDGKTSPVITDSDGRTPIKSGTVGQWIGVSLREA